jgi:hypothetical protein
MVVVMYLSDGVAPRRALSRLRSCRIRVLDPAETGS